MALFILFFLLLNNFFGSLLGFEGSNNNKLVEIRTKSFVPDQNVLFYKVNETLNLTCTFINASAMSNVLLEWVLPSRKPNSFHNRMVYSEGVNAIALFIPRLQEADSGIYRCKAVHNGSPFYESETTVRINIKGRKKDCTDLMFQCSVGICISKRYTCDGVVDCPNGEDEARIHCGPGNPCLNKLMCPDLRCIPFSWCCDYTREENCTARVKHSCCTQVEKLTRDAGQVLSFQVDQQKYGEMGFLQTTVYTVIGCAMGFMFIVTIIVIAICRVHVRRALLSRYPTLSRNPTSGREGNINLNNVSGWSIHNLDLRFNRPPLRRDDLLAINPLFVTYNINNGVQVVGRPIDPPPYCEIVSSPPKEGPPPPYVSRENLCWQRVNKVEEKNEIKIKVKCKSEPNFRSVPESEPQESESDPLLEGPSQRISVISCNAIDVNPPRKKFFFDEVDDDRIKKEFTQIISMECTDADLCCSSSYNCTDTDVDDDSGSYVNIAPFRSRYREALEQPSSFVSRNVGNKAKHVKKSLNSGSRRKSKSLSRNTN